VTQNSELHQVRSHFRATPSFRNWLTATILLVIVILFNWKLLLTNQFTWLESPDGANQILPWFQFQALQWHLKHFPLWDPNAWTGQPLFGQGQPGAASPLNWLLFLMPMKQALIAPAALNWYYALLRYIAALAAYALCRDLSCSRMASVLGACIFGLGGFVANAGWPVMVMGAILSPLAFLHLFRVERGIQPKWNAILSGFFLGLCWLSGHHQAPLYLSLAITGTWIWASARHGKINWPLVRYAVLSLVVAIIASAFQTLPMAEYGTRSVRWVGTPEPLKFDETTPYYIHQQNALPAQSLLSVFLPNLDSAYSPYIGTTGLTVAVLGLISGWSQRHVRWLGTIALAGLAFTIASNSLFHGIIYALVPMVEKARSPGAATAVFAVGIAPLAAIGLDRILASVREIQVPDPSIERPNISDSFARISTWLWRSSTILGLFGAVLGAAIAFVISFGPHPPVLDGRLVVTAFCALAMACLLAAVRSRVFSARVSGVLVLVLVLFELSNVTNYYLIHYGPNSERTPLLNNLKKHYDIAAFLLARGDYGRIEYELEDISYNFGDYFNLPTFQTYTASVTSNIWQQQIFRQPVRDVFGIRYSIAKTQQRPDQKLVFESSSGLKVFENTSAYPRVWPVHSSIPAGSERAASEMLASATFNAHEAAAFVGEQEPTLAGCSNRDADRVAISTYSPNRVRIAADLACPGFVILSDTYYPGWRATVDGKRVPIKQAYGVFRGVMVEEGRHEIEMSYMPASVIAGALLTGLAGCLAIIAHTRVRKSELQALSLR
jgi:hypothetical protein